MSAPLYSKRSPSSTVFIIVLNILKIGYGVIVDHVITSERIYKQLAEALKEYALIMVQVTCPLNELEKREKKRKDRYIGSAKASFEYLYPQKGSPICSSNRIPQLHSHLYQIFIKFLPLYSVFRQSLFSLIL